MQVRERGLLRLACAFAGAALLLAAAPPLAAATVRFASPTGSTISPDCTPEADACTLQRAVEVVALVGDEVIVAQGTYNEVADPLFIDPSKFVHGADGQAPPQINFTNPPGSSSAVTISGNSVLARASIRQTGGDPGDGVVRLDSGIAEQLVVRADGGLNTACQLFPPGGVLRDSICWASVGTVGVLAGVGGDGAAPPETVTATLRNVTAAAVGEASVGVIAQSSGGATATVDAKNVIAEGPGSDLQADAGGPGNTATIALEHSNYATTSTTGGGTSSVTAPGSGTNQTAPPLFANAPLGNFHQVAGSPTIDAGAGFFLMGSVDFEGDPRAADGSPSCSSAVAQFDIGADELVPASPDCASPETGISSGPRSRTRKRRANLVFIASEAAFFQCSLDKKPFVPCVSPQSYRKLKLGRHVFSVRAVDAAGNLDTSPAQEKWHILGRKK